ncbi:hypothetical protein WMY93_015318 [Mugilogobius chulae]|uniref:Uncharacterized protein n=1 Tax=Mugilogobius chulae TaxID=88201 RepID=A0AAW0P045_9GOBI
MDLRAWSAEGAWPERIGCKLLKGGYSLSVFSAALLFDTTDDSVECNDICSNLPPMTTININSSEVLTSLLRLQPNKTTGPDV